MQIIHWDPVISHFVLVGAFALQWGQATWTEAVWPWTDGIGADCDCITITGCGWYDICL